MDKPKILIVDDNKAFLKLMVGKLNKSCHDARFYRADSGEEALQLVENNTIDLLISDFNMPHMNGFDLLVAVKRIKPEMKVIIMTSYSSPELHKEAFEKGSVGYIEKPFQPEDLVELVTKALTQRPRSFAGEMQGIQVEEIIQLNCIARLNNKVHLTEGDREGIIYFEDGQIVHAISNGYEGEAAVREILKFIGGSFRTEKNVTSPVRTIERKWEQVLLNGLVDLDTSLRESAEREAAERGMPRSVGKEKVHSDEAVGVLIVDDSKGFRTLMQDIVTSDPDVLVVGCAGTGEEALDLVSKLKPDVVTMDINMPGMDGIETIKRIMTTHPRPIVIVSALVNRGDIVFKSMRVGAVDIVPKPPIVADDAMIGRHRTLIQRVKYAAGVCVHPINGTVRNTYTGSPSEITGSWNNDQITLICSSTGAIFEAVQHIAALPEDFLMPILLVLDIDPKILPAFVAGFDETVAMNIKEAADGMVISSSTVYIGSTRQGFFIQRIGETFVLKSDPISEYPIDSLFQSAALSFGVGVLAVLHAGLDGDGLDGCRAVHNVGGTVMIQRRREPWVPEVNREVLERGIYTGELTAGEFPWHPEYINPDMKTA